jgi:glycosyltransferase involved in cell wall biosynthesis
MSLPFLANDYTSRSHRNFLAAQDAGITTVVVTELGFPRILGVSEFDPVEVIDGIEHRRLDRGPGCDDKTMPVDAWAQAFAEDAYDVVREVRPSVLHVSSGRRGYETMLVGIALKEKTGLPLVYEFRSFHDATWTQRPALHDRGETYLRRRAMESMVMSVADVVLTLNEAMRDELVQMGCAPEKIHLVPNGVDVDHFAPRPRPRRLAKHFGIGEQPTFGYISNMDHPRESQETLVRAAEVLKKRGLKDFRCVIVGQGPRREFLEEMASASDVADVVVFTGTAGKHDVADYHALIDVFVVPRIAERAASLVTPLKPFEAMALGRPIVISDLPALREIAAPEERGLAFPPDDAVALADAVQRLFDDPELAARLGEAGREWVVNERQWSMNGRRYVEAFAAAKAPTVEP